MATLVNITSIQRPSRIQAILWVAGVGVLTTLLALLSIAIKNNPFPALDQAVLTWVAGWDLPVLAGFFKTVSILTGKWPALGLGLAGIAILLVLGKARAALALAIVGATVAAVAVWGDYFLGEAVGRMRPAGDNPVTSFPSGHVFGSTVFFGFWGFLAIYYRLKNRFLLPFLAVLVFLVLAVGPARIFEQAHWPSDVAAGYLLGTLWLLLLIPLVLAAHKLKRAASPNQGADLSASGFDGRRVERSIASIVVLDPQEGTATKVYRPLALVRLLYWLASQAKFPYRSNPAALRAAAYRRKIASMLTIHRFGKDLVAPVIAVNPIEGSYNFVTKYISGETVENDAPTKRFLSQIAETFVEAGVSVWQVNPHNPHAHTNLIRTPGGDLKVIDLESALVTPIPALGQWRSALRSGNFPVFDDIDFPSLMRYVNTNRASLRASLGHDRMAQLEATVDLCERAIRSWKEREPRVWGRLARWVYRLLNWKSYRQTVTGMMAAADQAAEAFLKCGMERWEREGKLGHSEAAMLRAHLSSSQVQDALHHLGVHILLSAPIPIPGLQNLAHLGWTLAFSVVVQVRRMRNRAAGSAVKLPNIHSPLVMALSLVPGLGCFAYLAARPLWNKLLMRLILDQVAWKIPFRLYSHMRLGRLLPPKPEVPGLYDARVGSAGN